MTIAIDYATESFEGGAADTAHPMGQPFNYLASGLIQLLETAQRELEGDHEVARASLVKASHILRSEVQRDSAAVGSKSRSGALIGWQISRVREFINANLHRTIHVEDLSAIVRRSPAHFSRAFKLAFGESPHAYVVRLRLEKACVLMVTSAASLSEIALSTGFSDQAHLCRLFRQTFGQSPGVWRRGREIPQSEPGSSGNLRLLRGSPSDATVVALNLSARLRGAVAAKR